MGLFIGVNIQLRNDMSFCLVLQLYQSENGTITQDDLAHILKTAMGVSQINVTHLFRAVDEEEKGKITYGEYFKWI